jgi:hypothetical protein
MTTLAVTGHMDLSLETVPVVRAALKELLAERAAEGPLVGLSCVARGADTLFAETLLEVGGRLVVVLPARDYREAHVRPEHAPVFERLCAEAAEVRVLPFESAGVEAYEAANQVLLDSADSLVAVWDGRLPALPAHAGGTGDAVQRARAAGLEVLRVWPEGARRG